MNESSPTDDHPMLNTNKEPLAPIDVTMKLDLLENPVKPPIVIYKRANQWDKLKMGLEPADQQIADRLQKLKDEEQDISLPTVEEIKQRLALLKDQNLEAGGSNGIDIHQVDTRTDKEKADDLIQEYLAQIELPSSSNFCKDIQERLNLLRDGDKTHFEGKNRMDIYKELSISTNDDNELMNKISAMEIETPPNAEYEEEDENKIEDEDEDENENECVMCSRTGNESDLYKCRGCTGDLYCLSCFESSHDESEMTDKHKAICFIKKDRDKLSSAKMSLIHKLLTSDSQKNNH
ncbi:hypothetical protein PUN28_009031 [Cardiocondyla obscurior]